MDIPDVNMVIIYDLPSTLTQLYQVSQITILIEK